MAAPPPTSPPSAPDAGPPSAPDAGLACHDAAPPTRPPRNVSLAIRLTLSFLLPTLLALLAVGVLADHVAQRSAEDQLSRRLIAVGLAARSRFTGAYYSDPTFWSDRLDPSHERMMTGLRQRLEPIWTETGVRRLFLFRPDGASILDTRPDITPGQPLYEVAADRYELEAVQRGEPRASVLYHADDGTPYKYAYVPIRADDGQVVAIIGVEDSAEELDDLRDFRQQLLAIGAAGLILIALASLLVARQLTRPIRRLADAAVRIGAGDLTRPITPSRGDELGVLERALEEMRTALADRDAQMQMMLSGVAHEVRNPLGGIRLFLGLLDEDLADAGCPPDTDTRDHVARIQRELAYLDRVVNEFLEFARRPRGLDLERLDARALLDDIHQVMSGDLLAADVALRVAVDPPDLELTADRDRLRRALLNLVRNAIQASPAASAIDLRVDAPRDGWRRLRVVDRGAGIPPERCAEVFKPFFTTREKGTGLGLPLTRKTIEAHGGQISIDSQPGRGTTVTLEWPFRPHVERLTMDIPEGWLG